MKDVRGKRVLITGGARGIGFCTAEEFARAGAELVITDINQEGLEEAAGKLRDHGVVVHFRVVDVSSRKQVRELAKWVVEELGGLDILINNAGIGHHGEVAETTLKTWDKLVAVNLIGPLNHIYAFLPHFQDKRDGHIVNVSSGQVFFRLPTWGAYTAIKAALGAVSEVMHYELRKYGIKVTTVYPFMVNTPFYANIPGETWGGKLAMQLVPYYSMTPEKVGRIIYKAVCKEAKVEMVSILNDFGFYLQFVPLAPAIVALVSNYFLAKKVEKAAA